MRAITTRAATLVTVRIGILLLFILGLAIARSEDYLGSSEEVQSTAITEAQRDKSLMATAIDMPARIVAIEERKELRAYAGAPPVIPHEIKQLDSEADCMSCHADEGEPENPRIPHAHLASCTQCHVLQENELFMVEEGAGNSFNGLKEPVGGSRAWKGAPPTIPHSTLMRERCQSCHGPNDHEGVQTSHPERLSCQQCHAPSAALNQRRAR